MEANVFVILNCLHFISCMFYRLTTLTEAERTQGLDYITAKDPEWSYELCCKIWADAANLRAHEDG